GIFDRNINDKVLMQVPELYHQSRKRAYFGLKPLIIYFFDGVYQSVVLFFFFAYSYDTTTARSDGYDINLFEWSTGIFDRNINDKVLMQVPELYHQSRKRAYFGLKPL
ncbi:hypothetical protein CKK21_26305, partial [Enterobacter cloacae]